MNKIEEIEKLIENATYDELLLIIKLLKDYGINKGWLENDQ